MANNPAGRLHELLDQAWEIASPGPHQSLQGVWARVFDLNPDVLHEILPNVGLIYALPSQVRYAVGELPEVNHELLLRHLPEIEDAMTAVSLHSPWSEFASRISPQARLGLEHCDEQLRHSSPEPVIKADALEAIHNDIRSLLDDLVNGADDLPAEILEFLQKHLSEMDAAVALIRIRGTEAFREAVEATVGGLACHSDQIAHLSDRPVLKRFVAIVYAGLAALSIYTQAPALPQATAWWQEVVTGSAPALPPGGQHHDGGGKQIGGTPSFPTSASESAPRG